MMNELKELRKQAYDYAMAVHDGHVLPGPGKATFDFHEVYDEKFAELIAKECADTAENCFVYWPMDGSLQRKGCANAIKKHFGVE